MNNRYILKAILINKDETRLTEAIAWIIDNYPSTFELNSIDEDEKYFILNQEKVSREYFPILKETINNDIGIHLLYYSNTLFPIPCLMAKRY